MDAAYDNRERLRDLVGQDHLQRNSSTGQLHKYVTQVRKAFRRMMGTKNFEPQLAAREMTDRGAELSGSLEVLEQGSAKQQTIAALDHFHGNVTPYLGGLSALAS